MYKKNILSGIVVQVIKIIFKFVLSVVVARSLGADRNGQVAYFMLVFSLISGYGHLGVLNALSYFKKNDICEPRIQFSTNIWYLLINTIIFGALLFLPPIKYYIVGEYSNGNILLGICFVLCAYIGTALEMYYMSDERVYEANKYISISMLITSAFLCFLCYLNLISLETYVISQILEYFISALIMYYKYNLRVSFKMDFAFFKRELQFGKYMYFAALFSYFNYRIDQIMIKKQLGSTELGIYSVAVSLAELLLLIPNSVVSSLTGKLLNVDRGSENEYKVLSGTIRGVLYICIVVAIVGIVCTPLIKTVYGNEYMEAESCFIILIIGIIGLALAKVMSPFYMITGKPHIHLAITFGIFLLNFVLNIFFIPLCGINGAAIASTISYLVYGLVYIFMYIVNLKFRLSDLIKIRKEDFNILGKK